MRRESGQATVEFALCLPLLALAAAFLVEVASVGVDQARVWQAAREAARVAAVDANPTAVRAAAERVGPGPVDVDIEPAAYLRRQGDPVTVSLVHHRGPTVPLVGLLLDDMDLTSRAAMRIEVP